jgi:hypothetical protein
MLNEVDTERVSGLTLNLVYNLQVLFTQIKMPSKKEYKLALEKRFWYCVQ